MPSTKITPAPLTRPLAAVAAEIVGDYEKQGKPVYYAAKPYVDAMRYMPTSDLGARYFEDSARDVVAYAVSNLGTWRGETATRVKAELKAAVADYSAKRLAR